MTFGLSLKFNNNMLMSQYSAIFRQVVIILACMYTILALLFVYNTNSA